MNVGSFSCVSVRAAAAAVGIFLLLTACSTDGGEDDEVPGVGETTPEDEQENGSDQEDGGEEIDPEDGVDRPDINIAETLDLVFEETDVEDPTEEAVLYDSQQQIRAVFEVLTTHDRENSSLSFYTAGEALLEDMEALDRIIEEGTSSGGVMVFYDREVTDITEDTAIVSYCRDFSEVYDFDFETGEVNAEPDADALPTHTEAWLELNESGVWQTKVSSSEQKSAKC